VQEFRIVESNRIYIVIFAGEYIEDNDAVVISAILGNYNLKEYFEKGGVKALAITSHGEIIVEF
jgi:hypothetical protein